MELLSVLNTVFYDTYEMYHRQRLLFLCVLFLYQSSVYSVIINKINKVLANTIKTYPRDDESRTQKVGYLTDLAIPQSIQTFFSTSPVWNSESEEDKYLQDVKFICYLHG